MFRPSFERLEDRQLLAVGPYLHVHNLDELAVVDASSGELEVIHQLTGFEGNDDRMNDIAFSPSGRLYGIGPQWLYEIHPVTGALTPLGEHGIAGISALVFKPDGSLQAMGREQPDLYKLTISDTALISVTKLATLSGIPSDGGSNGDITYYLGDLLVATTDNRLIRYRFDINPDRPRIIQEVDLAELDVTNVFGLATVNNNRLYATAGASVYLLEISDPADPSAIKVDVTDNTFGSLRGAAYFAEAGGPVPVGTLSGIKWFDLNKDGLRQLSEATLSDWPVYIDENLNGVFDPSEPVRQTDETGRFYFFGREPGLYTVDEIILNTSQWEQTYPRTPHRNLVGVYDFDNGGAANHLSHDYGLPDLLASLVSFAGGAASLGNVASYLELPWALGDSPFTIVMDAAYGTVFGTEQYVVSQMNGTNNVDRDFQITAAPVTRAVSTSFCNGQGVCDGPDLGTVDAAQHRYAITWDGQAVGSFFDGQRLTQAISGTRPDIDGQVVRFGNPSAVPSPAGLRGTISQIRVFNRALSTAELTEAFETPSVPNAYSVLLDDQHGIDGLNFGNAEPTVVEMVPEIAVSRDTAGGPQLASGDTIDLGTAASTDPPAEVVVWITNIGREDLVISDVTASAGFQVAGSPAPTLAPNESTSFEVSLVDRTQGIKTGQVSIVNNDADENPFVIKLTAEILDPDTRPRQILINSASGGLLRIDPLNGNFESLLTGTPALTDIAYNPRGDRLYGIDGAFVYEIDLVNKVVNPLFAHNISAAAALGFAPNGQLFAAGQDVYRIDLQNQTSQKYADGGSSLAGDIAFLGNRMLMSTTDGHLYEVQANQTTLLGNLGVAMRGLVATNTSTLYGFSENRGYLINVNNLALTAQFGMLIFTVNGATFQPVISAHNEDKPLDVDGDGSIVPLDVLLVINELNEHKFTDPVTGKLIGMPQGDTRYPDVDDDGYITPLDAVLIINYINNPPAPAPALAATVDNALVDLASGLEWEWWLRPDGDA